MKKLVCILALSCVIIGAAFTQAKPATPAPAKPAASSDRANAIGLDAFQLVNGFIATEKDTTPEVSVYAFVSSYERLISPHYSIGADLDIYFNKIYYNLGLPVISRDIKYFNFSAEGRYYPVSENLEKLFIGVTLGYSQVDVDGSTKPENGGFSGLSTSLKIGYKVITRSGFFLEPSLAYVYQKTSSLCSYFGIPIPYGWNGGLRLGYAF